MRDCILTLYAHEMKPNIKKQPTVIWPAFWHYMVLVVLYFLTNFKIMAHRRKDYQSKFRGGTPVNTFGSFQSKHTNLSYLYCYLILSLSIELYVLHQSDKFFLQHHKKETWK